MFYLVSLVKVLHMQQKFNLSLLIYEPGVNKLSAKNFWWKRWIHLQSILKGKLVIFPMDRIPPPPTPTPTPNLCLTLPGDVSTSVHYTTFQAIIPRSSYLASSQPRTSLQVETQVIKSQVKVQLTVCITLYPDGGIFA